MAKWCGKIGFGKTVETAPYVWEEQITERTYFGDILTHKYRRQSGQGLNDNLTISNELSIISDKFADENFQSMLYAEFMGARWKITNVEVQYPRLILSVGEVYHVDEQTT